MIIHSNKNTFFQCRRVQRVENAIKYLWNSMLDGLFLRFETVYLPLFVGCVLHDIINPIRLLIYNFQFLQFYYISQVYCNKSQYSYYNRCLLFPQTPSAFAPQCVRLCACGCICCLFVYIHYPLSLINTPPHDLCCGLFPNELLCVNLVGRFSLQKMQMQEQCCLWNILYKVDGWRCWFWFLSS